MTCLKSGINFRTFKCAAIFVAHFVCAGIAQAQEVTFRSVDNSVEVAGKFIAFDGTAATVVTDNGLVSFRAQGMTCDDPACPDLANYVPTLRITGAPQMGDVLVPALIDVYARDNGWDVREDVDGFQMLGTDETPVFEISLSVGSPRDTFAQFVSHDADVLLSMRELRASELEAAQQAGLGRFNLARQGRILALDTLVPVASPSSDRRAISLAELTESLSGQPTQFNAQISFELAGQLEGFEDRFMQPFGLRLMQPSDPPVMQRTIIENVEDGANGLTLLPYGATRNTQPLALTGPCGLQSKAQYLTMKTEDYPLTFPMFLYLPQRNQHPQIVDFLDWLRSPSAQLVIRRAGFVDLAAVPIPLADQGDRLANVILNVGVEIPLIELQ